MLNKNLNKHLKNHKNKDKQKHYGPIDTYRKFAIAIKAGRIPFTTVTEATRKYNRQYTIVSKATRESCQNFSERKLDDKKVLNIKY